MSSVDTDHFSRQWLANYSMKRFAVPASMGAD